MRWFPLLLVLCAGGCGPAGTQPEPPQNSALTAPSTSSPRALGGLDRSHAGAAAPDVAFQDPDGEPATLADFRGRPLLLNLWATWCAPCIKEMPTLDALAAREGDRLQVVTLSQDMEGRNKVDTFLEAGKFSQLEGWLDPEMKMMAALGIATLPTTILYDAQGKEVWRFVGDEDWAGKDAARLLDEARR
ncbi:TlpA disulfide reductase family protein [Sphingosinicella sp. BN140058]|uniref:TlpA family protein disulfide reductase n=1 Tax=Sphingosinicella sp. BN140058 TaxID=1892855 RepID=UPI00101224D4|nr:TlpA disulfide reductase family protein [Sphingosinicella sp. BN140058]QAY76957.1 TlpA family protein disulfide reductase [Sphingosinicella sp. BN140058]